MRHMSKLVAIEDNKIMSGKLGLECTLMPALAATTIEDLSFLTRDLELWRILDASSLYMLVKRPCLLLKGLEITTSRIKGEIIQIGNSNIINFDLPLLQENIVKGEERSIEIKLSHNNTYRKHLQSQGQELDNLDFIDTILLYEHPDGGGDLIKYITADLIVERTISQMWNCEIEGQIDSLLTFEVLYIGEAVRSKIWQRVENHEKIQQILSQESPKNLGMNIAHEIQVLFFKLKSTSDIRIINEMSREKALDYLLGKDQTTDEVLYFDVEKAFIKALKPKYNVQLYQKYPESKNGMMDEKYNQILYRIEFPYTLRTESNSFDANPTEEKTSVLHVDFERKTVDIIEE